MTKLKRLQHAETASFIIATTLAIIFLLVNFNMNEEITWKSVMAYVKEGFTFTIMIMALTFLGLRIRENISKLSEDIAVYRKVYSALVYWDVDTKSIDTLQDIQILRHLVQEDVIDILDFVDSCKMKAPKITLKNKIILSMKKNIEESEKFVRSKHKKEEEKAKKKLRKKLKQKRP
ncbi:hypothetical protein [Curvivirga sp.]|uniref:hypothetical protein n=1 Tax=Curvivirga sp. TaxID=2856848 RepID=UPI003B5BA5EE